MKTMKTIDFRKSSVQKYRVDTYTYIGKCPVTGIRLYEFSGSSDPSVPLGYHAGTELIASDYDMTGETVYCCSWLALNNDAKLYEQALTQAKKTWKAESQA